MPRFFLSLFCLLGFATLSQAQVLVYKLDFSKDKGINYSTFDGGYFIVPLLGGSGTFLLTSSEEGLSYTEAASGGRLFTAVNSTSKKAVISATTGAGTAGGSFVVIGDINEVVHVNGPVYNLSAKVAKNLQGVAVSADDESTADATATDGSIGSAGISTLKVTLASDETDRANRAGYSLAQAVAETKLLLERTGYTNVADEDDDDDDDDGGTDDGTDDEDDGEVIVVPPVTEE